MSVCIEQNHQNNFSQNLSACVQGKAFSVERITKQVHIWLDRSSQRKKLAQLDDRMLADIGITREQALQEIRKPFWK